MMKTDNMTINKQSPAPNNTYTPCGFQRFSSSSSRIVVSTRGIRTHFAIPHRRIAATVGGNYKKIKMRVFSIFVILILGFGCKHSDSGKRLITSEIKFCDSMIIPNDIMTFSRIIDSTYWIPKDTMTKNKNFIKYLKTKDSCCSDNLYINWGNDSVNRIFIAQNVLQYRTYFTPELVAETKDYLILEHGCATDCSAVLFLPLNNSEKAHDITDIIKYNKKNYTVIKAAENSDNENEHEFIEAVNIKTNKAKRIIFKNSGIAARLIFLIDSCNISDNEIYIRANLYDRQQDKNVIEELRLQNDIKK
jgi:hypothetical protein